MGASSSSERTKTSLSSAKLLSDFYSLGDQFFTAQQPSGITEPEWVAISSSTADLLNLNPESIKKLDLGLLSGNKVAKGTNPLAMVYAGHQFGSYTPQLGDGRGLLIGEIKGQDGFLYDLHLKGAGQTPYSRMGDGRAVLRSSIREYLCSEAMAALDVPTTRALSIVKGADQVIRERVEPSAMLCRVAQTHLRFGTFEYFNYTSQHDELKQLLDYIILRNFPLLVPDEEGYVSFYQAVLERTAFMTAKWQAVGFCHGVMNTDNMSIMGETFDYGPFGFMERYNPAFVPNHSDQGGRYAFNQQPNIGYWNCACLGQALLSLIPEEQIRKALDDYPMFFGKAYLTEMRSKLGLIDQDDADDRLVGQLLGILHKERLDYTNFFRTLAKVDFESVESLPESKSLALKEWLTVYRNRLEDEGAFCPLERSRYCLDRNPKYILRNYLAQAAIERAEVGDYSEVNKLQKILSDPFSEQPEFDEYAKDTPASVCGLQLSCSS